MHTNKKSSLDILINDFGCDPIENKVNRLAEKIKVSVNKMTLVKYLSNMLPLIYQSINNLDKPNHNFQNDELLYKSFNDASSELNSFIKKNKRFSFLIKLLVPFFATFYYFEEKQKGLTEGCVSLNNPKKNTIYYYDKPQDYILSHENIHILQQYHPNACNVYKELKIDFENMVNNSKLPSNSKTYLKYILKQVEFEARLHELIVWSFKQNNKLPESLNEVVEEISYKVIGTDNRKETAENYYDDDLKYISHIFLEYEMSQLFIFKIIPLLYSNLVMYYGDDNLSDNIKSEVFKLKFDFTN